MATIFDAADYASRDRMPAYETILSSKSCPASVTAEHDFAGTNLDGWQVGNTSFVLRQWTNGPLSLRRTRRHVRISAPERVSFSINLCGSCISTNRGATMSKNGVVRLMDLTDEYENHFSASTLSLAFETDMESLDLGPDDVIAVQERLPTSPLQDLAFTHLRTLPTALDAQAERCAPPSSATVQLMRALVGSVVSDDRTRRDSLHESQLARVDAYIEQHLHEPDLTPARVAAAQFISLRQLYKLFSARSETPTGWIVKHRLAAARTQIERDPHSAISGVARLCGFSDSSHFTRRFRAEYGLTPTDWAASHR